MEIEYKKSNREKSLTPNKTGKYWCLGCDANLVGVGQKCSVCGRRHGKKTIKKETSAR